MAKPPACRRAKNGKHKMFCLIFFCSKDQANDLWDGTYVESYLALKLSNISTPDCQKVVSSIFGQIELRGVYGPSDLSASVAVHIMPRNPPQVPFFPFFRKGRKLHAPFL